MPYYHVSEKTIPVKNDENQFIELNKEQILDSLSVEPDKASDMQSLKIFTKYEDAKAYALDDLEDDSDKHCIIFEVALDKEAIAKLSTYPKANVIVDGNKLSATQVPAKKVTLQKALFDHFNKDVKAMELLSTSFASTLRSILPQAILIGLSGVVLTTTGIASVVAYQLGLGASLVALSAVHVVLPIVVGLALYGAGKGILSLGNDLFGGKDGGKDGSTPDPDKKDLDSNISLPKTKKEFAAKLKAKTAELHKVEEESGLEDKSFFKKLDKLLKDAPAPTYNSKGIVTPVPKGHKLHFLDKSISGFKKLKELVAANDKTNQEITKVQEEILGVEKAKKKSKAKK